MSIYNNNNLREDIIFKTHVKDVLLRSKGGMVTALLDYRVRDDEAVSAGQSGLSHSEFLQYLRARGVELTDFQEKYLCKSFDDKQDGFITARTFTRHLCGLNFRRMKAVERAWESLEKDGGDGVPRDALIDIYSASRTGGDRELQYTFHSNERDALKSTLGQTSGASGMADSVCREEFIAFYAGVSQRIGSDEAFEIHVLQTWSADTATKPTLNTTVRDWGEEGDPLAIDGPRYVRDALNMDLGRSSKSYNYSHMERVHPYVEPLPPLHRPTIMESTVQRTYKPYDEAEYDTADPLATRRGQLM